MGARTPEGAEWISGREAGRRLGLSAGTMPKYAEATGIRRRMLKAAWTTYHAGDVDAMAAKAVIVGAGVAAEAVSP